MQYRAGIQIVLLNMAFISSSEVENIYISRVTFWQSNTLYLAILNDLPVSKISFAIAAYPPSGVRFIMTRFN